MTYRGSWRHTRGLGLVAFLLAVASAAAAWVSAPVLWLVPFCIVAWMAGLSLLWIRLDADGMTYRGWLRRHDVQWQRVIAITRTEDLPYPRCRLYGPASYEIRTADGAFVINLLYFSTDLVRSFQSRTAARERQCRGA
ncbi:MAG: PH domain-containing protein [Holophagales bacterium]|nr:MAG: PH domain-containing protein [Holophagales bacterium]